MEKKSKRNTTTDLAADLRARNQKGRLNNTIRAALDGYFHSWNSPIVPSPRDEMARQLSVYPETYDLANDARNGVYDDPPTIDDLLRLRKTQNPKLWRAMRCTDEQLAQQFPGYVAQT